MYDWSAPYSGSYISGEKLFVSVEFGAEETEKRSGVHGGVNISFFRGK
jgi:hypothetical protein